VVYEKRNGFFSTISTAGGNQILRMINAQTGNAAYYNKINIGGDLSEKFAAQ